MGGWVSALQKRFYPTFDNHWDDEAFRQRILKVIDKEHRMLDLGAGAGIVKQMNFRGLAAQVCGVDPDPRVADNPYLDVAREGLGERIPFEDSSFDIVFSANVVEHLAAPVEVFTEIRRVLKPGGVFLFKTPNFTHYMPMIAFATPMSFHRFYNRLRGRMEADTFPTLYRANTAGAVARVARQSGFVVDYVDRIEGRPEYLALAVPLFLLGLAYERIVNAVPILQAFRGLLIAQLRKPSDI